VVDPTGPIRNAPAGHHISWVVQLLPDLDARAVARRMVPERGAYAAENDTARAVVLGVLLCPSDPGPYRATPATPPPAGIAEPALTSYVGVHNDVEAPIDANNNGVFFRNSHVRYEDIEDGMSTTLFFGEAARSGAELGWASGTRATLRNAGWGLNWAPGIAGLGPPAIAPVPGDPAFPAPPGGPPATKPPADPVGGFGSRHPGGANFGFGDGSVRFLRSAIKPAILQSLANRADGALIGTDQF
jgi:prepilin-type processing-associated H-X9-DG protein